MHPCSARSDGLQALLQRGFRGQPLGALSPDPEDRQVMPAPKVSEAEFISTWRTCGNSPTLVARRLGLAEANVYHRRANLAKRGIVLPTTKLTPSNRRGTNGYGHSDWSTDAPAYKPRINATLRDGYCIIFSDSHFWPGIRSLAFEGLLLVLKELKPKIVISNGDAFDGASISRHDPLGWQRTPKVIEELDATKGFLDEVVRASPKAQHIFTAGNHDSRFDRRLAAEVGEFEDVPGMHLQDHLKAWQFCYGAMVNEDTDPFFVIHAIRGGAYAPRNNVLAAGCTVFTGHLHSQKSIPVTTLLHEWDGIDGGMVADRDGPQFSYVASKPTDWRAGLPSNELTEKAYGTRQTSRATSTANGNGASSS